MNSKYLPLAGAVLLTACTATSSVDEYNVTVTLPSAANGETAFLVDFDNGGKIDSVMVGNGKALFKGSVERPVLARVVVNGQRYGNLILEQGDIILQSDGTVAGGELNSELGKAIKGIESIQAKAARLPQDSTLAANMADLEKEYNRYMDSVIAANADNPIGYMFFINQAYEYDLPQLNKALKQYPLDEELSTYRQTNRLA